ncbi:hypothetical protein, partial [Clostridium sp.]|uniref:hypothetical protein n=1 Tax=Clostridium sp. TaxID=1506 RepID=UPI0035A18044
IRCTKDLRIIIPGRPNIKKLEDITPSIVSAGISYKFTVRRSADDIHVHHVKCLKDLTGKT